MRKLVLVLILIQLLINPVGAATFELPDAPDSAESIMPDETESFGEGLFHIVSEAVRKLQPSFWEAVKICICILCIALLLGLFSEYRENTKLVMDVVGVAAIGATLFQPVNSFIRLGTDTVMQISQYGNLLLPVMSGALAAEGAVTRAGGLYGATVLFNTLLSSAISQLLVPMVYVHLCLSLVCAVFSPPLIEQIRKFLKSSIIWGLKTVLYVFTGYISITGVVGGTTDAVALKATKLTISGMVPVVGNIISDASEAVLVSASIMKSAAGIYGLLVIIAIWIGPFLQIGTQYLLLKLTSAICQMVAVKPTSGLVKDVAGTMGIVLAMTGSVCLMFLISTICFMKGVS